MKYKCAIIFAALLSTASLSNAAETTSYSYDALGRLTNVQHGGTANNGLNAGYAYDPAGNRTNVTVTGAVPAVIVVPLNGFIVIPIASS